MKWSTRLDFALTHSYGFQIDVLTVLSTFEYKKINMATSREFVDFVLDQIENIGAIEAKKMFGEYGLYLDGKMIGLICDDKLFIKPTVSGRAYMVNVVELPPYEGAKPSFLIEEKIEDRKWLSELIRITYRELPEPKPKKKKS